MTTSFYLLCLLVMIQLIISVIIYDLLARRYRHLEEKMEEHWHVSQHRETTYAKLVTCLKTQNRLRGQSKSKVHEQLANEIKQCNHQLRETNIWKRM